VKWVNGEKTECWPQELLIIKLKGGGFLFEHEEYDLSEGWMSITSPASSK